MDWVNIISGFFTLASYLYIATAVFQPDEDLLPWWINDLGALILILFGVCVLITFSLICLLENLLDLLFTALDRNGAAEAEARKIAHSSRVSEAEKIKSITESISAQESGDEDADDQRPVSADFVQNHIRSRSVSISSPTSPKSALVLSPEDLEAFQGEFPGVTASDPVKKKEQLKSSAEEMAMLRREKELARVARASKRLGWAGKYRGDFGTMGSASIDSGAHSARSDRAGTRHADGAYHFNLVLSPFFFCVAHPIGLALLI